MATLRVGDDVTDFELPDQNGTPRRLSVLLANGPVVLFFYPAAMTKGCTAEACHFRDLAQEFADAGVQRVGISFDSIEKQKQFETMHDLDYPLLADVDGTVADIFGVARGSIGKRLGAPVKRWTFAIGTDRKIVAAIHSEMNMNVHADEALSAIAKAA